LLLLFIFRFSLCLCSCLDVSLSLLSLLGLLRLLLSLLFGLALTKHLELGYSFRFRGLEGISSLCVALSLKSLGKLGEELESSIKVRHFVHLLVGKATIFAVVALGDGMVRHQA